jgi:hypothetical protein
MKKSFNNSNIFLLLLILTPFIYRCKNADVSPENSIEGAYREINNPVLCTFPTMSDVVIKTKGTDYSISFVNAYTAASETLSGFKVEKGSTSKVFYKGTEVGTFGYMEYKEYSGSNFETKKGMVLMLNFEKDNKHYEFMGSK